MFKREFGIDPDETLKLPIDKLYIWKTIAEFEKKQMAKMIAGELAKVIAQIFGGK